MGLPIQITVGGGGNNPAAGATSWNDPSAAGLTGWVERTGYGPLRYEDYRILNSGGIELLNGVTFGANGDTWFFHTVGLAYETASTTHTNGFSYTAVMNALQGRIGFRSHTESGLTTLVNSANQMSRSYRYFNDFHAIVSAANLKNVQSDPAISESAFNNYLTSLQQSAIMRTLTAIFAAPEYLEQTLLLNREENTTDEPITNAGNFVGFEILVPERSDVAVQINSASLRFDSDITGLILYLFKDGKKSPVWSKSVNVVAYEDTLVTFSDLVLNYVNATTTGGRFFFGYFQDDLGAAKAIRSNVSWEDTYHVSIRGMQSPKKAGETDFDRIVSTSRDSYGLNLFYSVFRDHTQTIVKSPNLFDEAIGLTMAVMTIEQILYSMRSNGAERLLKSGIAEAALVQDLTGVAPVTDGPGKVMGLKDRLDREIRRVRESIFTKRKSQTVNLC